MIALFEKIVRSSMRSWRERLTNKAAFLAPALLLAGCSDEPSEPAPDPSPLVYQISNSDGDVEGWMLGTIHALPDGVEWRTQTINRVIHDADLLIVEIAKLDDPDTHARIYADLAYSTDLPNLALRLPPSQRPALKDLIERSGLPFDQLATIETWAAALALAQVGGDSDPENGVDRAVIQDFDGREVQEFEGILKQMSVFDSLPEREQRDLLSAVVEDSDEMLESMQGLRNAWLTGDLAVLEDITNTGLMADKELRDALLVDRNREWMDRLTAALLDTDKPLVAVGAAHLIGPDSLKVLLEQRGYTVTRLH